VKDASGDSYVVTVNLDKNGFRKFGDLHSKKSKVLFLGDSFTYAIDASDDKTYFSRLGERFPIEIFAYGGGGYGTLQEFMILDEYLDIIKPDIIFLQYCENDFFDNNYHLELKSRYGVNMTRPYLNQSGEVFYALPKPNFLALREFANRYSCLLCSLINRIDKIILIKSQKDPAEFDVFSSGKDYESFKASLETTDRLVEKVRSRVPSNIKIYAFTVNSNQPYYQTFKDISERHSIEFIDGVPQAIDEAEKKGITIRAADKGHWNEMGHQIAANILYQYLKDKWN
jgi:lysophospholipase L1-like esterase